MLFSFQILSDLACKPDQQFLRGMDPPTAGPSGSNLTNDAPPGDSSFNCEDFVPATPR